MINFTKVESSNDIPNHLRQIHLLSSKIEQKIAQKSSDKDLPFIESLSVEELKDLRQVMMAADYLLSKYQDKKDLKEFLAEFIGIIMHAANSVNILRDDLEDLVISAETALQQIQNLHEDVTQNLALGRFVQTKLDDYKEQKTVPEPSPINLTNTSTPVYTQAYLTKTAVEI
jgi:hypothetical protein